MEIELDEPYEIIYEELCDELGEDQVEKDIRLMVQNALHESHNMNRAE